MIKAHGLPKKLLRRIALVTNKRARFVLDAIAKTGSVSTADIKNAGYDHPPRAVMDAKDLGFAIRKVQAKRSDGRTIASYKFDEAELDPNKTGRVLISKKDRDALIASKGAKCHICGCERNFQLDHKIPFVIAGESQKDETDPYQILDGSCNRKKSWACEHCENWQKLKRFDTCLTCYWAHPESYSHVAMHPERRIEVVWSGSEVTEFDTVQSNAARNGRSMADELKALLKPKQS